ncbi:hypothetical protein F5888DRAFT_1060208 [Russula emetica]|nr:hypothetical protein F5888DRAFT_1060208 [Russula emetica]
MGGNTHCLHCNLDTPSRPPTRCDYDSRGPDNSNLCECSTVGYSLFSSCVAYQGEIWVTWSEWVTNCTRTLPPGSFPNPVPFASGIRVPQWALIDVTNESNWNPNKSYSVGDDPELAPGAILGPSGVSVAPTSSSIASSPTTTSSTSSTISPTTPILVGHSSNSGAIAGGVVGGIAAISITVATVSLYLRRRPRAPSAAFDGAGASHWQPHMDDTSGPLSDGGTAAPSSLSGSPVTMRFYVRILRLAPRPALRLCPRVPPSYFRTPRTQMTQLHSRGTLAHNR